MNEKQKIILKILESDVKGLKILLHTMINDMYSLSIQGENRTEWSDELQGQIEKWKEEIDRCSITCSITSPG